MNNTGSHYKRYVLAAALGGIGGVLVIVLVARAISKMMSQMMSRMMSGMRKDMLARMKASGVDLPEM